MKLKLNTISQQPLYQQIIEGLRGAILSGELKGGDSVPSIRELALTHSVSVITVQKAYDELVRGGLLIAIRGKGFVVQELKEGARTQMSQNTLELKLRPLIEAAMREGLSSKEVRRQVLNLIENLEDKQ